MKKENVIKLFRDLSDTEIVEFKQWARHNFKSGDKISSVWHPIIQKECNKIAREQMLKDLRNKYKHSDKKTKVLETLIQTMENTENLDKAIKLSKRKTELLNELKERNTFDKCIYHLVQSAPKRFILVRITDEKEMCWGGAKRIKGFMQLRRIRFDIVYADSVVIANFLTEVNGEIKWDI